MRTDYFLGQNRGDDYRSSIKGYSLQAWRDAGGEDGNEPYFEEDVQRRGSDTARGYGSTCFVPTNRSSAGQRPTRRRKSRSAKDGQRSTAWQPTL